MIICQRARKSQKAKLTERWMRMHKLRFLKGIRFATCPVEGGGAGGREERATTSDTIMVTTISRITTVLGLILWAAGGRSVMVVTVMGTTPGHSQGHFLHTTPTFLRVDKIEGISQRVDHGEGYCYEADLSVPFLVV